MCIRDSNQRSWSVAERSGFALERSFPEPEFNGSPRTTRVYVKLRPEWEAR